jgi:hypothetical protein
MKKSILIYFVSFLFISNFSSCEKFDNTNKLTTSTKLNKNLKTSDEINPYNYLGEMHDSILLESLLDSNFQNLTTSNKVTWIINQINLSLTSRNLTNLTFSNSSNYLTQNQLDLLPSENSDPEEYFDDAIENLSDTTRNYLSVLKILFHVYETDSNLLEFDSAILELEKNVFFNDNLSELEKLQVLGSISIGKHSFHFFLEGPGSTRAFKVKPWLADVGGFVVGAGTTIYGSFQDQEWGNPILNGVAAGTFASQVAKL